MLAGERSAPAALAGRWEFPGGKVEACETDQQALVRECREELGVDITVGAQIGDDLTIDGERVLRVYAAALTGGSLTVTEHRQLRWLTAAEMDAVPWLGTNRPLLAPLAELLRISSSLTPRDDENSR